MKSSDIVLAVGGLAFLYYLYTNQDTVVTSAEGAANDLEAQIVGWKNVGSGPQWVPILNEAEQQYGIPTDLLARQAFQESSFIEAVIRGTRKSSAGALGIMQMLPQYFSSVTAAIPYSNTDVAAQISQAGQQMQSLRTSTGSWALALAAYNAGLGNVQKYAGIPPFTETQNYVSKILADVPSAAVA